MKITINELRRRWALALGWTPLELQTPGRAQRTVWRPPNWVDGRALEEHELPFKPDDMNSVLAEYRGLDFKKQVTVIQRMADIVDRDHGNGEVEPTDVLNPAEIMAMIVGLTPEEMAEALVLALEHKEHAD